MTVEPPFLRTLAPLLRGLEHRLRTWLEAPHVYPLNTIQRATLEGLANDLQRQAAALDVEQPVLVVMLMGGTGVGKSTLLNALAGASVAHASFQRPTTRDPVVYFHQALNPSTFDPALRQCRLVRHDRPELMHKILVDTPDVDSNDEENRQKLIDLLPVADVVLYVGSQEKYHDQIGWTIFKEHRTRRAFAFVLNKWDRCQHVGSSGLRPDEDLLNDLHSEGFHQPRLFRTNAQQWVDANGGTPTDLPAGEQFHELRNWIELGLTRLEIDAVKVRGVGQLLNQIQATARSVMPPDLTPTAQAVRTAWSELLADEADQIAEVLTQTLDPRQQEIELQFTLRSQQQFRGIMAGYLRLTQMLRGIGRPIRERLSILNASQEPADLGMTRFAANCVQAAFDRVLAERNQALTNRLLVQANQAGIPIPVLTPRTAAVQKRDWPEKYTRVLVDAFASLEAEYAQPTGARAIVRNGLSLIANYLPEGMLLGSVLILLWEWSGGNLPTLAHLLMPLYVLVATLVILHILIGVVFPVRWASIRVRFREELQRQIQRELEQAYLDLPNQLAQEVLHERRNLATIVAEAEEISNWVAARETATQVSDLYGGNGKP